MRSLAARISSSNQQNLRDKDALVFSLLHQVPKGLISHGKDMWSRFLPAPALVHPNVFIGVDWEWAVRIHSHQEESGIGLG